MATNNGLDAAATSMDLHGFEQKAREHQQLIDSTNTGIKNLMGDMSSNVDQMMTALLGGTNAQGETALSLETKKLGELQAQNRKSDFLVSLGEDQDSSSRLSNQMATQFATSTREAMQLAQTVSQRKSVGFFDNPLEFIWNQLQLPDEENALKAKVDEANLAKGTIQTINQMESETAKNAEEYAQKITLGSVNSQVQGLTNNLQAQALETKNRYLQQNIGNLEFVVNADQKTLDNIAGVIAARNSAAHLALAQQQAAESSVRFAQWQKDNADTEAGREQALGFINAAAERFGKPKLDSTKLKSYMIINGGKLPPELQTMMEWGYSNGVSGSNAYGVAPVAAARTSAAVGVQPPSWFQEQFEDAKKTVAFQNQQSGGKLYTKPEDYDRAINSAMAAQVTMLQAKIDPRNLANPYLIAKPSVIAENKAVQTSALWNKVLKDQIGDSDTRDIAAIATKGIAAILDKKITPLEYELGINSYIRAGVELNNQKSQFNNFGVKELDSYNATAPDGTLINWKDATAVRENLVKKLSAMQRMGGSGFGWN